MNKANSSPIARLFVEMIVSILLSLGMVLFVSADTNQAYPNRVHARAELVVNEVHLSWTRNNDPHFKRYAIIRSTFPNILPTYNEKNPIWSTNDRQETSYVDPLELSLKQDYFYRVCAISVANKSACSNIIRVGADRLVSSSTFFVDVNPDVWYAKYVESLYRKRVIYPASAPLLNPAAYVTRAELAQMVGNAVAQNGFEWSTDQTPFCDVLSDHPQAAYINYLYKAGIVTGYRGGACSAEKLFRPNQQVNRAEALAMILIAFDLTQDQNAVKDDTYQYSNKDLFLDVHQSNWFAGYALRAKDEGIIEGYPDDTFRPENRINRAEMAKIISKAFRYESQSN